MLKVGELHRDRGAGGVDKGERTAGAVEKADRIVGEERVGQRQIASVERNGLHRLADQPARRNRWNFAALFALEAHQSALAPCPADRPAEARMQAAGVWRADCSGIDDFEGHGEPVVAQAVFDREPESEGIDGSRALRVAQRQAYEVRIRGCDPEGFEPGEPVQPERIVAAADPLAVASPADHGIEDRADVGPDRRIASPEQIAACDAPGARLGALKRNRRASLSMGQRHLIHSAIPSMATAETSASLSSGAQAINGLPLVRPSPARKSLA